MSDVNAALNAFRLASRELFNGYFLVKDEPYDNGGWSLLERFGEVEDVLFEQLVGPSCTSSLGPYGQPQPKLLASLRSGDFAPIMVHRDTDSGYWDHPVSEVTRDAVLRFVRFFNWDQLAIRDYRYVEVVIDSWPQHPDLAGKRALVESQYTAYSEA